MVLLLLGTGGISGQSLVRVGEEQCDTCALHVTREFAIGDVEGDAIVERRGSWLKMGPGNRYLLVAQAGSATSIGVFDPDGRFERRIGAAGQGPEEFQDIVGLQTNTDGTLTVFDRLNARLSRWSPALELLETRPIRLLLGNDNLYFSDGSIVTNGRQPNPDGIGIPVLGIDASGGRTAFNAHGDRYVAIDEDQHRRRLTLSGDTAFWSGHV
ncbi:MAG: 6-bladed beta-propeller, partial [Longimicrobiales bacterium]